MSANRFADCEDITQVVFQAVGAGSVCWENMSGTGIFQDDQARNVGDDAVARIHEILAASP